MPTPEEQAIYDSLATDFMGEDQATDIPSESPVNAEPPQDTQNNSTPAAIEPATQALTMMNNQPQMSAEDIQNAMISAMKQMQGEQLTPEQEHEAAAIKELAAQLGLPDLMRQNQDLQANLAQMQNIVQQFQTQQQIASAKAETEKSGFEFNPDAIMGELKKIQTTNPQLAAALDTPDGWKMIARNLGVKTQPANPRKPDVVLSSNGGNSAPAESKGLRPGMSNIDIGKDILGI